MCNIARIFAPVRSPVLAAALLAALGLPAPLTVSAQARDPGVRHAATDGGAPVPLAGVSSNEMPYFQDGARRFQTEEVVSGATATQGNALGPRFNSNSCSSCHAQPYVGGSSPAANPLFTIATAAGAANQMPWFEAQNGPVREARFVTSNGVADGGVHNLFVITGRSDAGSSCNIAQPSFLPAGDPLSGRGGNRNIIFRIPTPTLGAGLIEAIPDAVIIANQRANAALKQQLGVAGHPNAIQGGNVNRSANDGTVTRFGWKAQNKSLLMFAGEAYNVEMGISNQLFPQERDETAGCNAGVASPNDTDNFPPPGAPVVTTAVLSDIEAFANFMRMLAPPAPAAANTSTQHGNTLFASVGCALCHTAVLTTGSAIASGSYISPSVALSNQQVHLFSDLLVHHMGIGLADGITQGAAGPDEFRTAPLWGVGQRVFFLHDGRTSDLVQAIYAHAGPGSEANQVVRNFQLLSVADQQDLLNFLRSL
ncbi:MAG TPA: di-heme oxidoredictase family protein [Steroidobacteraceae bacterium]|nr:di-heme oxidoredictase family protein [Steroidobacteraceae bacterium]